LTVIVAAVVHEHMHQWTGSQQQPGEHSEDMRRVLGEQEESCYD
jgi:hypothetical protein